MAEEEVVDKLGQTVHPQCLVIGSFGRKEKDSQHLGHVPDVMLKNTDREALASCCPSATSGPSRWLGLDSTKAVSDGCVLAQSMFSL